MLFNSPAFLFVFLPIVLLGYFRLGRSRPRWAAAWLTLASFFFYAWWNPVFVWLLLGSAAFNFGWARPFAHGYVFGPVGRKLWLASGVSVNLVLLGYFKYAHFAVESVGAALGMSTPLVDVVLPLGISFFTFTQIAYLVDAAKGQGSAPDFLHYALFVSYFPHLIAGPVLHHAEIMPQFAHAQTYRLRLKVWVPGLTLFTLGLFKKAVLADGIAPYVDPTFILAAAGQVPGLLQAWGAALAYSLQLYFDFSGYSDMAVGLSCLIGVRLPINFNSPYKACSIAEFWRRWHMTLSRFLRDYLYIPLGGNRKGAVRRCCCLVATMALGGLWHGAGWTFVLWGFLHGLALVAHQAWQGLRARRSLAFWRSTPLGRRAATLLTFLLVVMGWVIFKASSLSAAAAMLAAMVGHGGVCLPLGIGLQMGVARAWLEHFGIVFTPESGRAFALMWTWILALLLLVFLAPNTQQIMGRFLPMQLSSGATCTQGHVWWRPSATWAVVLALVLALDVLSLSHPSAFLYFQF